MPTHSRRLLAAVLVSVLMLTSGCAAQRAYKKGQRAMVREDWDKALSEFLRAKAIDPENHVYSMGVERARLKASQYHFHKGQTAMLRGQLEEAVDHLEKATVLDPSNTYYVDELEKAHNDLKAKRAREDAKKSDLENLKDKVRADSPIVPVLALSGETPISLKFTDTDVKEVYSALGKFAGINILMDETIRDKRITIDLQDVTFKQGLDTLLLINLHYYKVIDEKTIIIIPDNQTKRRQYDELVIKTFYLSSADINEVQQLVQRLINTRFMSTSKQLNSITIRDTADKVAIAERIIEANDKAKAEVIIDVELLEINRTNFESLGMTLSTYSITQTLLEDDEELGLQLSRIDKLTQNDWFLKFPTITYQALKRDTDSRLIAKPQMRVSEGEKASILIGDRVPVPTTTFNTNQTQGGNVVPITSFQYQDVGIKINFEPRVHHNKEVTLKLKVEVSQIIGVNESGQPTIGTRTIETVIRLKEGETNLLAGLIRQDVANGRTGLPGLAEIPLLGKLFSINTSDVRNTDLVLTLTPHIIRLPNITGEDLSPLYVGTEDNTSLRLGPRPVQTLFPTPEDLEPEPDGVAPPSVAPTDDDDDDDDGDDGDDDDEDRDGDETASPGSGSGDEGSADGDGSAGGEQGSGEGASAEDADETADGSRPPDEPPSLPAVVSIQPTRVETSTGGTFSVDVLILQATNVGHVPFYVNYDATVLEYQGAVEGDFLKSGGASTQFQSANSSPGLVIFGCSRMGSAAGASGSGRLATMTFRALKAGATNLTFSNNSVMSPAPGPLPSSWQGGQVNVQ